MDPPTRWDKPLLGHLLSRGCRIDDFRCVWSAVRGDVELIEPGHRWRRFEAHQLEKFVPLARVVEPKKQWTDVDLAESRRSGVAQYIGFSDADEPASVATMFAGSGACAYLAWAFTRREFRGQGFQCEAIRLRVRDAFDRPDCTLAFAVTDFNTPSARNLQRCGFRLAYNYLLLRRDPVPL